MTKMKVKTRKNVNLVYNEGIIPFTGVFFNRIKGYKKIFISISLRR